MKKWFGGQGWRLLRTTRRSAFAVLRRKWGLVAVIVGAGFLTGALATGFSEMFSLLINSLDHDLNRNDVFGAPAERFSDAGSLISSILLKSGGATIGTVLTACFVTGLLIAIVAWLTGRARASINAEIYQQLRQDAFERCFNEARAVEVSLTEEGAEGAIGTVTLASSLNRGADSVSETYTYLLQCAQQLFALLSAIATSRGSMVVVTIACIVVMIVQVALAQMLARRLKKNRKSLDTAVNKLQARTSELLDAREVLLAFDKADKYKDVLRGLVGAVANLQITTESTESRYNAIRDLIDKWGQLAVFVLLILLAINIPEFIPTRVSEGTRDTSIFIFALTFYNTLLTPARQLISGYDSIKRSEAVVGSFLAIFSVGDSADTTGKAEGWTAKAPIVFDGVSYTPPGGASPIFTDFDIVIPGGSTTLILGPSGCGKTTLGRLSLGFLVPDSGTVSIGGGPLPGWSGPYLHKAVSYAPQIDQILNGTIAENLRLAEDAQPFSDHELETVLDMVKLKPKVGGRLAIDAKSLSGGEMQRLSAARILLDHAEILLLDEPMAGVDVFTMADIAPAIERHWRKTKQTVLLISHKLIFAGIADHVVVLGEKGVVEQGSPAALIQQNGIYARLRREAVRQVGG